MMITVFVEGANVYLPAVVELYSGFEDEDADEVARRLFPHLEPHQVYGEMLNSKTT
jgi:hypothetical protein